MKSFRRILTYSFLFTFLLLSCSIYPGGEKAEESHAVEEGDILIRLKKLDFEKNYQELRRKGVAYLNENKRGSESDRVRLLVASADIKLGLMNEASTILEPLLEMEESKVRLKAMLLMAEVLKGRGKYESSADGLMEVLDSDISDSMKRKARVMLLEVTEALSDEDLRRLADEYSSKRGIDIVLNSWLSIAHATSDTSAIREIKGRMDKLYSEGLIEESYFEEGIILPPPRRYDEVSEKKLRVGVLCPMSGRFKALGDEFIRGISIALAEAKKEGFDNIEVIVGNSQANSLKSHFITEKLINEEGVSGIIGGISTSSTVASAQTAQFHNTVFISPIAMNENISDIGDCVFQYRSSHETEIIAVSNMACLEIGMERFAFLGPDNISSRMIERLFRAEIERLGGVVCVSRFYPEGSTDFKEDITLLRENYPEALFIASDPEDLVLILPQLSFYEFGVQLLGTSDWKSNKLLISVGRDMEGVIFPVIDQTDEQESEFIGAVALLDKPVKELNPFVLGGYIGLKTFIHAVRIASEDSTVAAQLNYTCSYERLCGALREIFTRRRHPFIDFVSSEGITFYIVRNSEFSVFDTVRISGGK
jgi:ABC-type branched-subunit amino acid transport system substrate-binding protein